MKFVEIIVLFVLVASSCAVELKEDFEWKELEFDWPNDKTKASALSDESYIPGNSIPLSFAIWHDKMFIATPRFRLGVPSTLNYIKIGSESSPSLIPYPSWETNTLPSGGENVTFDKSNDLPNDTSEISAIDNSTSVSVFRVVVDKCNRLWAMDMGRINIAETPKIYAKPSLIIYDLNTNTVIRRHFLDSYIKDKYMAGNIVVDADSQSCEDAYAYVADFGVSKLIVYSFKDNTSWKIKHHYFYFDPLAGQYNVGGVVFQWKDGIFGLALSKPESDGTRNVIFHPTSSTKEFEVSNRILQNETLAMDPKHFNDFKCIGDRGNNTQSSASYFDEKSGILFYTQLNLDGVGCWNSKNPMSPDTSILLKTDSSKLEFPNDLKIDEKDNIWILSSRLPKFVYQSLDKEEINFRIMSTPVKDTLSICK